MSTYIHLVWFSSIDGKWVGEWTGEFPDPCIPLGTIGKDRLKYLNEWMQQHVKNITPTYSKYIVIEQMWDTNRYNNAPNNSLICLDVTQFNWPIGDHIWHIFDSIRLQLTWPNTHKFMQINTDTMSISAYSESSRPIRNTESIKVIDITDTPMEKYYAKLWGSFINKEDKWMFIPEINSKIKELSEAVITPLIINNIRDKVYAN